MWVQLIKSRNSRQMTTHFHGSYSTRTWTDVDNFYLIYYSTLLQAYLQGSRCDFQSIHECTIDEKSFFPWKIFVTFIWFMFFTIITGNTIDPIKIMINVNMYCWLASLTTMTWPSWYNTNKVRLSIFERFKLRVEAFHQRPEIYFWIKFFLFTLNN